MRKNYIPPSRIREKREAIKKILQQLETIDIGNEIKLLLEENNLSCNYLADLIHCERSNISKICKRKNNINLLQLVLISVALDYNLLEKINHLLKKEPEKTLPDQCLIEILPNKIRIIRHNNPNPIVEFAKID